MANETFPEIHELSTGNPGEACYEKLPTSLKVGIDSRAAVEAMVKQFFPGAVEISPEQSPTSQDTSSEEKE